MLHRLKIIISNISDSQMRVINILADLLLAKILQEIVKISDEDCQITIREPVSEVGIFLVQFNQFYLTILTNS